MSENWDLLDGMDWRDYPIKSDIRAVLNKAKPEKCVEWDAFDIGIIEPLNLPIENDTVPGIRREYYNEEDFTN